MGDINYGDKHYYVKADSIGQLGDNYGQKTKLSYNDRLPDLSHFQGRVPEQAELYKWLADPTVSLIGVKGEGGIGKSTLTAKVFADCAGFGGKCWVDVRSGTTLSGVARSALQEFGVPTEQVTQIEEKDLPRRLLRQMQMQRCLLAIDNLESVLGGDGAWQSGYEEFLDGFQELGGESVILLAGREYPERYRGWRKSRWLEVDTGLEPGEGAALLGALEAEGTEDERSTISVQVEGNPLALALLAGWLREEYRVGERSVAHLETQPDLFQVEGKHRGDRLSLADVFDWSFDRLSPAAQELLVQVSVLRGGFNHEAAGALVQREVADGELQDLERRSLLQELPGRDRRGQLGYRLQPRVQDFAQKRGGDLTQAHDRAIQHFWSQRQTEFAPTDTEEAAHEYLETYYHECCLGRYQNAAVTVLACDAFLRRRGYTAILASTYEGLYVSWQPAPDHCSDYAALCNNLGSAYCALGQYYRAINLHQQCRDIQMEIGNRKGEAISLGNLGLVHYCLGQYDQAIEFYEQCRDIQAGIGDKKGEAYSLGNLGLAFYCLGQYNRAIKLYEQCRDISREIYDSQGEANSLGSLGAAYNALGQYGQAINLHQQALTIAQKIGDRSGEANSLGNLGNTYRSLGQYDWAINLYQMALAIAQEIENRRAQANFLGGMGDAHQALGQYDQAINLHQQSLVIKREISDRNGEATSLGSLGIAYQALGQYDQAINLHQQHCDITRKVGDRNGEANSLGNLGIAYSSLGQYDQAVKFYEQGRAIQREIGDRNGEATSLFNQALSLGKLDQHSDSLQCLQKALVVYTDLNLDHRIEQCKAAISQGSQIIADQQQPAPTIKDKLRFPLWLWLALGLAGALLVWWLKR